jgi:primary-amine oxidase
MMFRSSVVALVVALTWLTASGRIFAQAEAPPDPKAGQKVEWEGWSFNWSVRTREGLVLTNVYYRGHKVLHFAGIMELFTVYDQGSPRPLDINDGGLGARKLAIIPGVDCSSGEWCKVFEANGKPMDKTAKAEVMLHEEKSGPNYLGVFGRTPGKTLVLWMASRFVGGDDGYTFIVRWKFRDDGTLIPEVGATGVPQHLKTGLDTSPTGAFIGLRNKTTKVFAPSHVHNYLYRLDFAVDGEENTVEEFNWEKEKEPGKDHIAKCTWTPLLKETGRPLNPETFRSWRVVNRQSKNALGHMRSYHLIPGNKGIFRGGVKSEPVTQSDLWVTLAKANEFPRSSLDSRNSMEAVPKYADGESVADKAVVVWYWLGSHHFPRSEDWLHQPVIWQSFELMPRDFLDGSPLQPPVKN